MSQQLHQESELRRSSRTRDRKSCTDYFSDDDVLTEHEDDDIEEQEDLLEEKDEYEDGSDDEYSEEEEEEEEEDDEKDASGDSSDNDSGKEQEANEGSVKEPNPKFACGFCSNILSDPYIIPACCHRFCCKCIQESIQAGIGPCPTCRDHSVSFESLRRDEMMGRLLARYKMLQEKIQKKHDTQEKRTFETYEAVQEEIDGRNKPTESRARKRQKRESADNELDDLESRKETEEPIQFSSNKKIVTTQERKKQKEYLTFEERLCSLRDFKKKYGHVNVPKTYSGLGSWCSSMRSIKAGTCKKYKHPDYKLTKKRMKVLDDMGFRWTTSPTFDENFHELKAYEEKHGHCSVPRECKDNKALGNWCKRLRTMKSGTLPNTGNYKLTPERIKRLDALGFRWRLTERLHRKRKSTVHILNNGIDSDTSYGTEETQKPKRQKSDVKLTFEEWLDIMKKYKEKHGHCNIPSTDERTGGFCKYLRDVRAGKTKQDKRSKYKLTKDRIKILNDLGFCWSYQQSFDDYFSALQAFKVRNGHCNVPSTKTGGTLGSWVSRIRRMKAGTMENFKSPQTKLTEARIAKLDGIGFQWVVTLSFEDHVRNLKAYKEKHGNCNVPGKFKDNGLGYWVYNLRRIKAGTMPPVSISTKSLQLTEERIKELDSIGFKWKGWKTFDEYMIDLQEFKVKHGHCDVPFVYPENKSLGSWVGKIRRKKLGKTVDNGSPDHKLTKERIVQLEKMGFNWSIRS